MTLRYPQRRHRATSSIRSVFAVALPLALLATACAHGAATIENGASAAAGLSSTTTTPKVYPLTGLPVTDPATANRPTVTVKIENSPQARPQAGLDKADVIFEPVVEGGQTRFLAMFQSQDADSAGPVRSVRPSDPAIVLPFGGIVAYSGGIQMFVDAMMATGLVNVDEDNAGSAYHRRSDREAPHNLYTSTQALYQKSPGGTPPPKFANFLKPGQPFNPPGATPVTHINLIPGITTTIDWAWDASSGTWLRSTDGKVHTAEGGGQLSATTVIVQYVPYSMTDQTDVTGSPVFEGKVTGSGDAVIFANGMMLKAKWSKPDASSMTTWTDVNGAPISLPAGRTWVEVPDIGAPLTAT